MPRNYVKDPAEIYRQSFATIEAEARLDRLPASLCAVARRMIHACGMTDLVDDLAWHGEPVAAARRAIAGGAPILTDAQMVASGIIRGRFPQTEVVCMIAEAAAETARRLGTTRSAAAVELWRPRLAGAVVAIGNAPTALFHLLEMMERTSARPAAVIGIPVGFVGAVESKEALAHNGFGLDWLVVHGRRGGSAITAAAVNAIATEQEIMG